MRKKPITNEELARLISKGFDGVQKQFREMATKADLKALESHMATSNDLATMKDAVLEGVAFLMAKHVPRFVGRFLLIG